MDTLPLKEAILANSSRNATHQNLDLKRRMAIINERSYLRKSQRMQSSDCIDDDTTDVKKMSLDQIFAKLVSSQTVAPSTKPEPIGILTPISVKDNPFLMNGSILIGKSSSCDLDLTKYGICENVSDLQATLIHDKVTNTFELLDYGRTPTLVDGVPYGIGKSSQQISVSGIKKRITDFVSKAKEKEKTKGEMSNCPINESCIVKDNQVVMPCDKSHLLKSSIPGYAVVRHGTKLSFGCIEFVFCSIYHR